jgi:hypothetical protein
MRRAYRRAGIALGVVAATPVVLMAALALVVAVILVVAWVTGPSFSTGDAQKYFDRHAPGLVRVYGCKRTTVVYEPTWACAVVTSNPKALRRLGLTERSRVSVAIVCFPESGPPRGLGYPEPYAGTPKYPCGPPDS